MKQSSLSKARECLQEYCTGNFPTVKIKIRELDNPTFYPHCYEIEIFDASPSAFLQIQNFIVNTKLNTSRITHCRKKGFYCIQEFSWIVHQSFSKKIEKKAMNFLKKRFPMVISHYPNWEDLVFLFLLGNIQIGDKEHLLDEFWQEIEQKKGKSRNGK